MAKNVIVGIGDQLFEREDGQPFGAVLAVHKHELLVAIEGFGQTVIPGGAVKAVHDGKVIVELTELSSELQQTIARAHDRETEY